MHLEYLKIFTDLARCRSFSQTAQRNEISQSAVSHVVLQLERRLETRLVDRSRRPLQLTNAGKAFNEGCRTLLGQYQELEASIRKADLLIPDSVQVAAIYSVGLLNMSRYVERFSTEHPSTAVHLEYLHPRQVYERVLEGSADFGLISYARTSRELAAIPWRKEEMLLACPPNDDLARHPSVRLTQLNGRKYIGFTRDLAIRQNIDRFLRQKGIAVDVVLEFDNIECVKRAIEIGSGVALLPEPMLRHEARTGSLAALSLAGGRLVRPLSIIYRRNGKLSASADRFIDLILQPEETRVSKRKRRTADAVL